MTQQTTGTTVGVRYFAGAAAAAGVEEESVALPAGATVGDLVAAVGTARGTDLTRVLAACSFLLDGVAADRADLLPAGAVLDVLPPFAGG
ncbi:MoaD/ThiS family protein [Paenibacillus sp. TRM 82003]|uniref:MoaD/ThiS family protein n=1 Tax=Kineococcus sp. TRM81007 TaxID=2925831 RepID=UPI001F575FE1|nr:MoaD/ThiS family protein [Kineococcus sp. TRM81007]MCI2239913.1 MoaD/ThiS family protein [Kineococcus sp. TRM81007]MCI3925783.1 MoaD/ThiS family protein [Paenibacillus sp. TRM 82003]